MSRTWTRWVPAAAVALVVAAGTSISATQAEAEELQQRTPQEVLTLLAGHEQQPFSAEFEQTSDLGLPELPADLPNSDAASALSTLELVGSDHHGRVFAGSDHQLRLQLFESSGERDLIVGQSQAWLYDSSDNSAARLPLPEESTGNPQAAGASMTPDALAQKAIDAVEPSTDLSVRENVTVAGRTAYDLVLTPHSSDTLIGTVSIAVDGETGMPLRVAVTAQGADSPALQVAYTDLDLGAPDPDLFTFTPPEGATVTEVQPMDQRADASGHQSGNHADHVIGQGWDAIFTAPAGTVDLSQYPVLGQLTSPVDGGHVLSTALVSALVTDDGQVLLGAVPAQQLQEAA